MEKRGDHTERRLDYDAATGNITGVQEQLDYYGRGKDKREVLRKVEERALRVAERVNDHDMNDFLLHKPELACAQPFALVLKCAEHLLVFKEREQRSGWHKRGSILYSER